MNIDITTQPATEQELDMVRQGIFDPLQFHEADAEAVSRLKGATTSTSRLARVDGEVLRVCWNRTN